MVTPKIAMKATRFPTECTTHPVGAGSLLQSSVTGSRVVMPVNATGERDLTQYSSFV